MTKNTYAKNTEGELLDFLSCGDKFVLNLELVYLPEMHLDVT